MDRRITVRFYQIESEGSGGATFEDSLRRANDQPLDQREAFVGDVTARLEYLTEEDGFLMGDLTRVQTENLPSHPTRLATDPLPIDRLGHHTAFCFDPASQIMALQFDMKLGVRKLCSYATSFSRGKKFSHLPVLQQGALEHFDEETPVKLRVAVAKVQQFTNFADELTDFERGFERMGALFDAPQVEISLSCRGRDGGLNKETVGTTIRRLLRMRESFNGIRSIMAETDETPDPFNFIRQLLKRTETLDLPANEPAVARATRIGFARRCIDDELAYIRQAYTQGNAA